MAGQGRLGDRAQGSADAHGCPACPHPTVGPGISGSPDVLVNGRPALRKDDPGLHAACCGPNTWAAHEGSATVFINGKAAHRIGDKTRGCGGIGQLIEGSSDVFVGGATAGGGGGGAAGGGSAGGAASDGGGGSGGGGTATRGAGGAPSSSLPSPSSLSSPPSSASPASSPSSVAAPETVTVTLRLVGGAGEPLSASFDGTQSGTLKGETTMQLAPGPFDVAFREVAFVDPIPPEAKPITPRERPFRRGVPRRFGAIATDGAVLEAQLVREVAAVVEIAGFADGGAVVLPDDLPAIATCLSRLARGSERLLVAGHGQLGGGRALNVLLLLTGLVKAWAAASAARVQANEQKVLLEWAAQRPGWPGVVDRGPNGLIGPLTFDVIAVLYTDALCQRLGVTDLAQHRERVRQRLAFSSTAPSPPPPPDPLYRYGTDRPPHRGRSEHYPFLRCTIDAQVYPVKLATQATGDAADYRRSLNALNPHLCKNGQWSLALHDEINLPEHYASALRPFIEKEHYEIHLAPPSAPVQPTGDPNIVECGASHLRAPHADARRRRAASRQVEVLLLEPDALPPRDKSCNGAKSPCAVASCRLYDPREYDFEYLSITPATRLEVSVVAAVDESPLAGVDVQLFDAGDQLIGAAVSSALGQAAFAGLEPGAAHVLAQSAEHVIERSDLVLSAGNNYAKLRLARPPLARWIIDDAPAPPAAQVPPPPTHALVVRVIDGRGSAVVSAEVRLAGPAGARATTGADGRARLDRLVPGRYLAEARKEGHLPSEPVTVTVADPGDAGSVGATPDEPTITLDSQGDVDLVVVHQPGSPYQPSDRQPIRGAVALYQNQQWGGYSDDQGRIQLAFPTGQYELRVKAEGFAPVMVKVEADPANRSTYTVHLPFDESIAERRARVVELAEREASSWAANGNQKSWPRLKHFFRVVRTGSSRWSTPIAYPSMPKSTDAHGNPISIHWCGIFATSMAQERGRDELVWVSGRGPARKDEKGWKLLTRRNDVQNAKPGDILHVRDVKPYDAGEDWIPANHHCLLVRWEGDRAITVEGNTEANPPSPRPEVKRVTTRPRSSFDFFFDVFEP